MTPRLDVSYCGPANPIDPDSGEVLWDVHERIAGSFREVCRLTGSMHVVLSNGEGDGKRWVVESMRLERPPLPYAYEVILKVEVQGDGLHADGEGAMATAKRLQAMIGPDRNVLSCYVEVRHVAGVPSA